jgi:hypothetical protein
VFSWYGFFALLDGHWSNMVYRLLTALTLSVTTTFGALTTGGSALEASTTTVVPTIPASTVHATSVNMMHPELRAQLKTRKAGSVKFWEAVSWCETNHDWDDHGYYAGGLGIAQVTWRGYGGWQFAKTPMKATKEQQIIVANRISFLGFQTKNVYRTLDDRENNRPFFRPAIGWRSSKNWGRGCINWETRKPLRERYTEAGMAEWKKTRP